MSAVRLSIFLVILVTSDALADTNTGFAKRVLETSLKSNSLASMAIKHVFEGEAECPNNLSATDCEEAKIDLQNNDYLNQINIDKDIKNFYSKIHSINEDYLPEFDKYYSENKVIYGGYRKKIYSSASEDFKVLVKNYEAEMTKLREGNLFVFLSNNTKLRKTIERATRPIYYTDCAYNQSSCVTKIELQNITQIVNKEFVLKSVESIKEKLQDDNHALHESLHKLESTHSNEEVEEILLEEFQRSPLSFAQTFELYPQYNEFKDELYAHLYNKADRKALKENIENMVMVAGIIGASFITAPVGAVLGASIAGYELLHYIDALHETEVAHAAKGREAISLLLKNRNITEEEYKEIVHSYRELESDMTKYKFNIVLSGLIVAHDSIEIVHFIIEHSKSVKAALNNITFLKKLSKSHHPAVVNHEAEEAKEFIEILLDVRKNLVEIKEINSIRSLKHFRVLLLEKDSSILDRLDEKTFEAATEIVYINA